MDYPVLVCPKDCDQHPTLRTKGGMLGPVSGAHMCPHVTSLVREQRNNGAASQRPPQCRTTPRPAAPWHPHTGALTTPVVHAHTGRAHQSYWQKARGPGGCHVRDNLGIKLTGPWADFRFRLPICYRTRRCPSRSQIATWCRFLILQAGYELDTKTPLFQLFPSIRIQESLKAAHGPHSSPAHLSSGPEQPFSGVRSASPGPKKAFPF